MIKAAILTISDSCAQHKREDLSGQTIAEILAGGQFDVCACEIVADEREDIENELIRLTDELEADLVLTTGGTGLGPRDVTPEATAAVCQRMVPGPAETMRSEGLKKTRNAMLSRAVAGIRGNTLIINLPGSPKGAKESLEAILDVLPHAHAMLLGHGH